MSSPSPKAGTRLRWIVLPLSAVALAIGLRVNLLPRASAQDADPAAVVAAAVEDMEGADPDSLFSIARELDALGADGVEAATTALDTAGPRARLGLARYLIQNKERRLGLAALERTIREEDPVAAPLAAEMLERYARTRREVAGLKDVLMTVRHPAVKIAVAKVLRAKASDTDAERVLKDYLGSDDYDVRAQAALALGELGNIQAAKAVLDELSAEPTPRGKRARGLLYQDKLFESLSRSQGLDAEKQVKLLEGKVKELSTKAARVDRLQTQIEDLKADLSEARKGGGAAAGGGAASMTKGHKLLAELVENIKRFYVEDGEKIDEKTLFDAAAKGLVGSLDPFSSYMTEKETEDFQTSMQGSYAGIGAVVSQDPKDKLLTIVRPIYSGPAYRAGLRSLDKVTQVEGESTFGKTVEELVSRLKGPAGSPVKIKVYRKGWKKEREFTLTRERIRLKSVQFAMLPGKIGYVSLSQFGDKAVEEVELALQGLEADGMKALVFDLRQNPGGLLKAAVAISDKFLKDNKLIVYSQGRNPHIAPRRNYYTQETSTHPDYPLFVLVNKSSASASEIVSGALQDHGRAVLVGENTFGKGSVQQLLRVRTTANKSTLRLTIAKYYLPSGRSIHRDHKTGEGGVDPDIVVEIDSDVQGWEVEETDRLLETGLIEAYVDKTWKSHKAHVKQLAEFDGLDPARYPDFDALFESLGTTLAKDRVRMIVRGQLRRLAQDDNGSEFATDLQADQQLQRAVYEALKKLDVDPATIEEYTHFSTKFAEAPKEKTEDVGEPR